MNHAAFPPDAALPSARSTLHGAARPVHRAVAEARRGVPVIIREAGSAYLALPAETASPESLMEFLDQADPSRQPVLLLAPARASTGRLGTVKLPGASTVEAVPLPPGLLTVSHIRALADPTLIQPPHAVAEPAGLDWLAPGVATSAVLLAKLARLLPAMLLAPAGPEVETAGLLDATAQDVAAYPLLASSALTRAASARVPLDEADDARIVAFRPPDGGIEHLAVLIGAPEQAEAPLVRLHSECFTGDLLGSRRCDCGPQLHQAIRRMAAEGAGVLLYMAQEGRGIGLVNKLRAYTLQDAGLDTLDANEALGFDADERRFGAAAAMLAQLGITRIRLLTNNPDKLTGLAAHGITVVGRVSHAIAANGENDQYLETKARRFGHLLG
jgi:GTP cyclohydrolase II